MKYSAAIEINILRKLFLKPSYFYMQVSGLMCVGYGFFLIAVFHAWYLISVFIAVPLFLVAIGFFQLLLATYGICNVRRKQNDHMGMVVHLLILSVTL